jgi:hypothetical protein
MYADQESIDYQNDLTCTIEYIRRIGQIKVIESFKSRGWGVTLDRVGWIQRAEKTIRIYERDCNIGYNLSFRFEKDFHTIHFKSDDVAELIVYWLPAELRFCTFTFRKMEAEELPDYIEMILRDNTKQLNERLMQYKQSL